MSVVEAAEVMAAADFGRAAAQVFQSKIDCPSVLALYGRGEVRGGDGQCGWVSDACVFACVGVCACVCVCVCMCEWET